MMEFPVVEGPCVLSTPIFIPASIIKDARDLQVPRVPEDLQALVQAVTSIIRFAEEPRIKGLVLDNTAAHLLRCAYIALNMQLPQSVDRDAFVRMLWFHDLTEKGYLTGEGLRADISVLLREYYPEVAMSVEESELTVASEIFGERDMYLYLQFVETGKFLRGQDADMDYVTPEAIIAHAIDRVEGNTYFYFWITEHYKQGPMPAISKLYLHYTMDQAIGFFEPIFKSDLKVVDVDVIMCLNEIYLDQLSFIQACWARVPLEQIPDPYRIFRRTMVVCSPVSVRQFL